MSAVLVDTHAAIWYLTAPERLSPRNARRCMVMTFALKHNH